MITHIISDMGGVLVALEWSERVSGLLGRSVPIDELHHLWSNARSTVDFESGRIDFDTFAQNFIQEFDLQISPEQVQHEFLEFVQAPMPGCDEILTALNQQYHLSLLSNTNPAHYLRLRDRYDFYAPFEQVFLSHEIGVMKPETTIFHHVLKVLDIAPDQAAFFDDGEQNVAAAQSIGINAYQVHSPQELRAIVGTFATEPLRRS